jgi:hypothetical protein
MLERRKALDVPPDARRVRDRIAFRRAADDPDAAVRERLDRWWDALCRQRGLPQAEGLPQDFGRHMAQLVRQGLTAGDHVLVGATVSRRELTVRIQDDGPGLADALRDRRLSGGSSDALDEAIAFADQIEIESRGRVVWKTPLGMQEGPRATGPGTRILLRKFLRADRPGH